ncbi:dihydroxyacetone kinase-like protein [Clostridium pascui]|uniref:dihydroxyacetone kinase subunit DhaL n=1 Tax=Clostridium pascui TaxID=46609 RepID=UPI0024347DAB|nr:dihydroxyacetone kinase subunit DhaL [Clostridium pascui]MBM7871209.1 dihydroxyacetone kinase-like protein [Clostridium pascui]
MKIGANEVKETIKNIAKVMAENKEFLTELDANIGDADHGINMCKGFKAVIKKLNETNTESISEILKITGMTLVSNVGGASGPLYGTAFMKASMAIDKDYMDIYDLINMLQAALEGIKVRGKSQAGEKTMIDVIEPALNALVKSKDDGLIDEKALENMKDEALKGLEHTKSIIATKGRAAYLGERSIGHQDPGATSSYLMLNEIYKYFINNNK